MRHVSGGLPPLDICARWDGERFGDLEADPYTATPASLETLADALFERPDRHRRDWDITGWVSGEQ